MLRSSREHRENESWCPSCGNIDHSTVKIVRGYNYGLRLRLEWETNVIQYTQNCNNDTSCKVYTCKTKKRMEAWKSNIFFRMVGTRFWPVLVFGISGIEPSHCSSAVPVSYYFWNFDLLATVWEPRHYRTHWPGISTDATTSRAVGAGGSMIARQLYAQ